jgi:hypothetical protein
MYHFFNKEVRTDDIIFLVIERFIKNNQPVLIRLLFCKIAN